MVDMTIGGPDCPGPLDTADASGVGVGFLGVDSDEFEREELQNIRDRARRMSIPTSARKTEEEWQYKKIADAANILDALYARDEQELAGAFGTVTVTPTVEGHGNCPYGCCSGAHTPHQPPEARPHRRPFLGGYRKS